MSAFKHVLVATDFGRAAERAEEFGIDLAEKFGARLTLLFVFSVPNAAYATGSFAHVDRLEREAYRALEAEAQKVKERFASVESVLRTGTVWEEILAVAKETRADLIAMGTHGRRGLPRALLGSVAERVVRMATVPVLTVAASEDDRAAAPENAVGERS
jgi:nucleotide-binding universal stress UspA family protein